MDFREGNLRHARNLTQAELASRCGLDRSYIGSIEQARRNISIDNIDRLAEALGVQARDLLARIVLPGEASDRHRPPGSE
ncbi:MAG TPA: helix-turn-helix transcriptional regulator [Burkholderiaceae bacterium]